MAEPAIAYAPHPGASPQAELDALVAIYCRAIERYEENRHVEKNAVGAGHTDGDDKKGRSQDDFLAAEPEYT